MRTADLTGALLDYHTARAEGVPADQLEIRPVQRPDPRTPDSICVHCEWDNAGFGGRMARRLDYSTNWALAGPLLEKHEMHLTYLTNNEDYGPAWMINYGDDIASTPLIAICRAVVRAAFGDEVGDLPCP